MSRSTFRGRSAGFRLDLVRGVVLGYEAKHFLRHARFKTESMVFQQPERWVSKLDGA
ncbi:MAG: hypothetical protein OJF50_005143 [Nitrospira sp.]|nr:hypothetical protein [Nitrospira sp.]